MLAKRHAVIGVLGTIGKPRMCVEDALGRAQALGVQCLTVGCNGIYIEANMHRVLFLATCCCCRLATCLRFFVFHYGDCTNRVLSRRFGHACRPVAHHVASSDMSDAHSYVPTAGGQGCHTGHGAPVD